MMFYQFDLSKLMDTFTMMHIRVNDIIEIIVLWFVVYYVLKHIHSGRLREISKGIALMLGFYAVSVICSFTIISYLFGILVIFFGMALVVMLQPELRRLLEKMGTNGMRFSSLFNHRRNTEFQKYYSDETVAEIIEACHIMSGNRTGALILLERDSSLLDYAETGIPVNAVVTRQLLLNIFEKNTPLHDGAVLITNNRITYATCYLPLTQNLRVSKDLGTRHRAAIGASEEKDALVIVVSEETGAVSVVCNGNIQYELSWEGFSDMLHAYQPAGAVRVQNTKRFSLQKCRNLMLSLVFALVLWFSVASVVDPVVTVTVTGIPVTIQNESAIENKGYVYDVVSGDTVQAKVTGKKSLVSGLTAKDFTAYADASALSLTDSMAIEVQTADPSLDVDINTNNAMVTVKVEEEKSLDCPVEVLKYGTEADGYWVSDLNAVLKSITVVGPASVLNTIDKAVARVNVTGADKNFTCDADYTIYDKNGNPADLSRCEVSAESVTVMGVCYHTKKVPVRVRLYDSAYKDAEITVVSQTLSQDDVVIAGKDADLDDVDEIVFKLDIASNTSNLIQMEVNPMTYVPENVAYVGDNDDKITVDATVTEIVKTQVDIDTSDIDIRNGKADITSDEPLSITVSCDKQDIDKITTDVLAPYIDLKGFSKGPYDMQIQIADSEYYDLISSPVVSVLVK